MNAPAATIGNEPAPEFNRTPSSPCRDDAASLRVVVVYDNVAAGHRALEVLSSQFAQNLRDLAIFPALWCFKTLSQPEWREWAKADIASADLLIISASEPDLLFPGVNSWVTTLLARRNLREPAILTLFGNVTAFSFSIERSDHGSMEWSPFTSSFFTLGPRPSPAAPRRNAPLSS